MDLLAFMEKKRTELSNTGHIMDDETFITHRLNSLPQKEYEGAILVIKERLRRSSVDLPEMEQILEDKYQSMKHVKGWDEEEADYALFMSHSNKKGHKTIQRKLWLLWRVLDIRLQIVLIRKAIRTKVPKEKLTKHDSIV